MTPRPSMAHAMARTCLAGLSLFLLAIPPHGWRFDGPCAAARPADAFGPHERDPVNGHSHAAHQPLAQRESQPAWHRAASALAQLPARVHPIGLASDGEPHDAQRQPAADRAPRPQQ